ncbi:hypothetical protein [Elizabethkingia anophelis]|uniref:hypothetical protein n=1 Tax=Elizabethkingia anophelis TaxID=1117645 RepID=UPI00063A9311|nr:hypothetical protein [Elizabethkingia anophelis]AKH96248.1 hypothetical protein M876_16985 [Elizabethkingia anophelis FMS-007]
MQKVIVIDTHMNTLGNGTIFNEKEFPQLNGYLEEGYTIKQVTPVILSSNPTTKYSIIFVLEKITF